MNRIIILMAVAAALAACQSEPRSQAFFEANDAERAEVLADCKSGAHRGEECQHAELAAQTVARTHKHATRRAILQQTIDAKPAEK